MISFISITEIWIKSKHIYQQKVQTHTIPSLGGLWLYGTFDKYIMSTVNPWKRLHTQ